MATPEGSTVSVLIADDDSLVRRVVRMAFESRGYRVHEAADADAVITSTFDHLDLVVLDVNMPGGTVHDTLGALRGQHPLVPVLVLSGETSPPDDLPLELADFACKPIDLDELLSRVELLLQNAASYAP